MSRDVLLGLILAALVIIILSVALFPGAFNFFETFKQDEVCKERIGLASFSKSGTGKPLSPLPLECPRNVLLIKYKDVVRDLNVPESKYLYALNEFVLLPYYPESYDGNLWRGLFGLGRTMESKSFRSHQSYFGYFCSACQIQRRKNAG